MTGKITGADRAVVLVLIVAFGLRFAMAFLTGMAAINTDTTTYIAMADSILRGEPQSFFPNGFPLIIAAAKLVAGAHYIQAVLLLNVVMSTAVVGMSYLIARRLVGNRVALAVALVVALWPNQLNYVRQVMSEVPATFFLVAGLCAVLRFPFWSGFSTFVASMVRTTFMPVAPVFVPVLLYNRKHRAALLVAAGFVVGYLVDFALRRAGVIAAPSNMDANFLIAISSNSADQVNFSVESFPRYQREHALETYLAFARAHPWDFLVQRAAALWELWGPWPSGIGGRSIANRALIGLRFPLLILAVIGLWRERRNVEAQLLAVPVLIVTATHMVFFATPRFSYPVEPLVAILAGAGIAYLASLRHARTGPAA